MHRLSVRGGAYRWRLAASGNNSLGLVLKYLKRNQEAEQSFRKAIETIEPLARGANALPDDRMRLCQLRERLGLLLYEMGRNGEAKSCCGVSLKSGSELAAEYPSVPKYREPLVSGHINLAVLLSATQREPEAVEIRRSAVELAKKLTTDMPTPYNRLVLGRCYYNLGGKLGKDNRDEQEVVFRRAVEVLEKLVAEYPAPEEYRWQYQGACHVLGVVLKDSGGPG